jgi:hypothetical protein
MKILCIADHVDPLVYSGSIKSRFADAAMVLSAGDLPVEYYDFIVSMLNKPLFFVFGNHNLSAMDLYRRRGGGDGYLPMPARDRPGGAVYIGSRVVRSRGMILAGMDGSMWYNGEENQFTEVHMFLRLLRFIPRLLWNRLFRGRYLDILVTHAPPYGIHDRSDPCHRGFRSFRWFIRTFKPRYLVHGHIHLYSRNEVRQTQAGATTVVNAYDHCLIELEA